MGCFIIDQSIEYSYDKLLNDINTSDVYCPMYQDRCLYNFYVNFIVGLISNAPIILVDSDLSESEIADISSENVNERHVVNKPVFSSIDEIINSIKLSSSEITIFTSGTTGQPKKVVHSVTTLTKAVRLSPNYNNQVWGFAYNPTHMAGLQVFFQIFENKCKLVNIFNSDRTTINNNIETYDITHISATPTFYRLLLPIDKPHNSVKRITLGGEKSDKKLYESIEQLFPNAKINNIYASTEAGSLLAAKGENFQIPNTLADKIKVKNDEIIIHRSLLGSSDSFNFTDDYYYTGDIVEWIDEKTLIFKFKSRKNELINVGGYKVNPSEVETLIMQIEGVIQAQVFGKKNSVLGNILCANVLLDKTSITENDIRNYLSDKIQNFKIPRIIKFVDNLELTKTGKIKRL